MGTFPTIPVIPAEKHYLKPSAVAQYEEEEAVNQEGSSRLPEVDSDAVSVSSTVDGLELLSEGRNLLCPPETAAADPYLKFNSTLIS